MLRTSSSVAGSGTGGEAGLIVCGGAGTFGIAKCADTAKVAMSLVERTFEKNELRWSNEYGARYAASSCVAVPGMSVRKRPFASMRIAFVSGCGWLATVVDARRLSVKLCSAASAS